MIQTTSMKKETLLSPCQEINHHLLLSLTSVDQMRLLWPRDSAKLVLKPSVSDESDIKTPEVVLTLSR